MLSVRLILEGIGSEIVERLKNDIQKKVLVAGKPPANASGKLAESLRYEATEESLKVYALDYIYYLQFGRKPGKKPPKAVIRKWIDDKGIVPEERNGKTISKDSLAFLIQRAIGEKGTMIYQQGGSDLLSSIINEEFIRSTREQLIFNIVESVKSEVLKIAA